MAEGITSKLLKHCLPNNLAKVKFKLDGKEVYFICTQVNKNDSEVVIHLAKEAY